jgi:hypothetical protein
MAAGKLFGPDLDFTAISQSLTEAPVGNARLVQPNRHPVASRITEPRRSGTAGPPRAGTVAGGVEPRSRGRRQDAGRASIVVAARASNSGGDMGQVEPTLAEIEARTGKQPNDYLVDGGFAKRSTIETLTEKGIRVLAPVMNPSKARDPDQRQRQDGTPVAVWRERMATEAAIAADKDRAATIETVNADLSGRCSRTALEARSSPPRDSR